MSIRRGSSIIASSGSNGLQMFDMKWSDHTINDLNWISSHSNSYHSGNTYKKMYNHLVEDYHNGVDETEVIDSYTISYKLAPDGHKIVDAVSSGVVDNIYEATGIAWYYVLDTTNQQFKLPRTKYGFTGLRDTVGNYVPETLPDHRHYMNSKNVAGSGGTAGTDWTSGTAKETSPASESNSVYQNGAPVQQRATQMLLYFYTNQFESTGLPDTSAKNVVDDTLNSIRTNCITEIPQNIKLELNDGVLTLKAGSKVYVPNGAGVFDEYTMSFDKNQSETIWGGVGSVYFVYFDLTSGSVKLTEPGATFSGSTQPTLTKGWWWYDTTNNIMRCCDGTNWNASSYSLPIALVTSADGSTITSIDQVFNGFGYIGSTAFALPGVKGLIPNGRNADGTLNSVTVIIQSIQLTERSDTFYRAFLIVKNDGTLGIYETNFYNEEENYNRSGAGLIQNVCRVGILTLTSGVISNFNPKNTFHAVDYNDKSTVVSWGMPSDEYIEYTATNGGEYTAPANGYFTVGITGNNAFVFLTNKTNGVGNSYQYGDPSDLVHATSCSVKKGDVITLNYNATVHYFRFIYAQGEL